MLSFCLSVDKSCIQSWKHKLPGTCIREGGLSVGLAWATMDIPVHQGDVSSVGMPGWEQHLPLRRKGLRIPGLPITPVFNAKEMVPETLHAVIKSAELLSDLEEKQRGGRENPASTDSLQLRNHEAASLHRQTRHADGGRCEAGKITKCQMPRCCMLSAGLAWYLAHPS
jgi:hypothetical protein